MPDITEQTQEYFNEIEISKDAYNLRIAVSPLNRRIRLIDYRGSDLGKMVSKLDSLAGEYDFVSKIYGKVRKKDYGIFKDKGYLEEGEIKGYFNGQDAILASKYTNMNRRKVSDLVREKEISIAKSVDGTESAPVKTRKIPRGYSIKIPSEPEDFQELAELYKKVFGTYPFPIMDPEYLKETSESHILYSTVRNCNNEIVAAASAEMDVEHKNAEMTDFATLPSERGKGLAAILLQFLENSLIKRQIVHFYTIARSRSFGMNMVFKKAGYARTGKLINNCYICGQFENMTVWCKNEPAP